MAVENLWFRRLVLLLPLILTGCRQMTQPQSSAAQYLVTERPVDIGMGIRLCVAVDPSDEHGVWEWMPGRTGCDSRSSGPGVFHHDDGGVSRSADGQTIVRFRVGTISDARPYIDVQLTVEDDVMTATESRDRVQLRRRNNLNLPALPGMGSVPR